MEPSTHFPTATATTTLQPKSTHTPMATAHQFSTMYTMADNQVPMTATEHVQLQSATHTTTKVGNQQPSCKTTAKYNIIRPRIATATTCLGEVVSDSAAVAGVMCGLDTRKLEISDSVQAGLKNGVVELNRLAQIPQLIALNDYRASDEQKSGSCSFQVPADPSFMTLAGHDAPVMQMELVEEEWLITCSLDETVALWSVSSGEKLQKYTCTKPATNFKLISQGSKKYIVLLAVTDGTVAVLLVKLGKKASIKPQELLHMHHPNPIRAMDASRDGRFLATGCCFSVPLLRHSKVMGTTHRGTLKLWDLKEILMYLVDKNSKAECNHLALRTSRQLISGNTTYNMIPSYDRLVKGAERVQYGIGAVAFTPDSMKLAVGLAVPETCIGNRTDDTVTVAANTKMLIICCANTLNTLWVQCIPHYQVTSLGFGTVSGSDIERAWAMLIATPHTLSNIVVDTKGKDLKWDKVIMLNLI